MQITKLGLVHTNIFVSEIQTVLYVRVVASFTLVMMHNDRYMYDEVSCDTDFQYCDTSMYEGG